MSDGDAAATGKSHGDDESRSERVNRELIELLNELRVALPGVQVLFAFLLAVPFGLAALLMLEPDFGATVVLGATALTVLFVGGARLRDLGGRVLP